MSKKPSHQNSVTGYPELQKWPLPSHPTRKSRQPLKVSGSATPDPPQPPPLHTSFQSGQPEMKAAYRRSRDDRIPRMYIPFAYFWTAAPSYVHFTIGTPYRDAASWYSVI